MINKNIKIFVIPTGELETNSVVIARGSDCVVFDPSGDADAWFDFFADKKLTPIAVYLTHGHYDHIGAVADIVARHNIPWHMNPADKPIVTLNNSLGWMFGGTRVKRPDTPFVSIADGMMEILPGIGAEFISTPGHTPGSGCFYFPDLNLLISGDTIFADTVGRCDLPMGNWIQMNESVNKIKARNLPGDTHVIPGHGRESNIAAIVVENRFFQ